MQYIGRALKRLIIFIINKQQGCMVVGFPLLLHSKWETRQHGLGIPSPPSSACGFDAGLPDHAPPQGCRKVSLGPGRALDAAPSCVPLLRPRCVLPHSAARFLRNSGCLWRLSLHPVSVTSHHETCLPARPCRLLSFDLAP